MSPSLPHQSGDAGLLQAKSVSNCLLGQCPREGEDLFHNNFRRVTLFPYSDSVRAVLFVGAPLQIGKQVVGFDAIDVIDLRKQVDVRNKGTSDKPVDAKEFSVVKTAQPYAQISIAIHMQREDASAYSLLTPSYALDYSVQTSNGSKITDFVEDFEVVDRDRSPFFYDGGIHKAGHPSGDIGSMIKDPSRATTFGGSAIMASVSEAYNGRH